MRVLCLVLALILPASARAARPAEVRHLLDRAGFGAPDAEVARLARLPYPAVVDHLLAGLRTVAVTPPPAWVRTPLRPTKGMRADPMARTAFREALRGRDLDLKRWWYGEMIHTDSPLTERMVLLYHGLLTSSLKKVRSPTLMFRQNALFRREAGGNFARLLHEILRDPAMLRYLDNQRSRKAHPNENLGRELMELFTLGVGHYTEADVHAASKALTGYQFDPKTGAFRFRPRNHDDTVKTFLGRTGDLDGDAIVDRILAQPAAAVHLVTRVWTTFVSPTPDPKAVRRLAALVVREHWEMKPLLRAVFLSKAFRDPKNAHVLVKSPAVLLVGTVRAQGREMTDLTALVRAGRRLGEDLFDPPNVKGWPGGSRWIDATTLLSRRQILARFARSRAERQRLLDPTYQLE